MRHAFQLFVRDNIIIAQYIFLSLLKVYVKDQIAAYVESLGYVLSQYYRYYNEQLLDLLEGPYQQYKMDLPYIYLTHLALTIKGRGYR